MKRFARTIVRAIRRYHNRNLLRSSHIRIHLGCGAIAIPGWINVDAMHSSNADILDDVRFLHKFRNESVDVIYACHVLEHFAHDEIEPTLKRWHEVLKTGGELRISVPDTDRIVKIYNENWEHFQTDGNTPWIGLIYGGQKDRYDFHKTGFNFCWMKSLLERSGFYSINEYPHMPHFINGISDASQAKEPFGEYISLNVVCRKKTK